MQKLAERPTRAFALGPQNDTSITLDLLRALAAQMVCVGHAFSFFLGGWPAPLPLPQNVGVLLFFLLSGFLIAYTLLSKSEDPRYDFWQFAIDRFARIYSGLVPALLFVLVVDFAVIHITGEQTIARYFDIKHFVANLFMLEAYRGALQDTFSFSAFGSAAPLWTLAIEFHVYLFVGALFFLGLQRNSVAVLIIVAVVAGQTATHYLLGAYQPDGVGRALFGLWLMGVFVLLAARSVRLPMGASMALAAVALALYLWVTKSRQEYDPRTYPLLALFLFGMVATTQRLHHTYSERSRRLVRFAADYSFTLYLIHHTIMLAMVLLWSGLAGKVGFVVSIALSNLIAVAIAMPTEMRHKELARWLKRGPMDATLKRVGRGSLS